MNGLLGIASGDLAAVRRGKPTDIAVLISTTVGLSARQETYVEAARSVGVGNGRIMARHILPNVVAPLIILSSMRFGSALLTGDGLRDVLDPRLTK